MHVRANRRHIEPHTSTDGPSDSTERPLAGAVPGKALTCPVGRSTRLIFREPAAAVALAHAALHYGITHFLLATAPTVGQGLREVREVSGLTIQGKMPC